MPAGWKPRSATDKWPGRKAGSYRWFEIQDSTAYWEKFLKVKLVSTKISSKPTFSIDKSSSILGNTSYLIDGGDNNNLLAIILNSSVSNFYCRQTFLGKQGGFYEVQPEGLSAFAVPLSGRDTILNRLDFSDGAPPSGLEQLLNGLVYELYFPTDLHARGLTLFAAAEEAGLDRLSKLTGPALTVASNAFVTEKLAPGTRLRTMLSDLQTLDVVRIIEGKA